MPECPNARVPERPNARTPERPNARMPECPNARTPECPNARLPECPDARMPERPNAPMHECANARYVICARNTMPACPSARMRGAGRSDPRNCRECPAPGTWHLHIRTLSAPDARAITPVVSSTRRTLEPQLLECIPGAGRVAPRNCRSAQAPSAQPWLTAAHYMIRSLGSSQLPHLTRAKQSNPHNCHACHTLGTRDSSQPLHQPFTGRSDSRTCKRRHRATATRTVGL